MADPGPSCPCAPLPRRAFPLALAGSDSRTPAGPHGSLPPEVPPPPLFFFQRSGVLSLQGHYIWLQSSFMPRLGC